MRERSVRSWRCCAHSQPRAGTRRRVHSPQFWCADASSSSAATGTVRLHASSHARGLKLFKVLLDRPPPSWEPPLHCHWLQALALPPWPHLSPSVNGRATRTCSTCISSLCLSPVSSTAGTNINLRLGSDTARRYFSPLHKHTRAQQPSRLSSESRFGTALLPILDWKPSVSHVPGPSSTLFLRCVLRVRLFLHVHSAAPKQDMNLSP